MTGKYKLFRRQHLQRKLRQVRSQKRQIILLQFLGGALEYYDFFSFTFIFFYLLKIFNHHLIELYGIAIVALVSFLFRPIGYRVFIFLAKRYSRPAIVTANSTLMTISILATGLMPLTNQTNIWATFGCLVLSRALHGISFGIKLQANLFYIKNTFPKRLHHSLAVSIIGAQFGLTCAIFINKLLYTHLSASQLEWGWRIPFFLGGLLSIILYITRMFIYRYRYNYEKIEKAVPLDQVAFKSGPRLWLALVVASSRACTMFTLFVIVPNMLNWLLKWDFKDITNIMLAATITNSSLTWLFRRIHIDARHHINGLIIGLLLIIPSSLLFSIAIWKLEHRLIIACILIIAAINGYLFVVIPKFIEQLCNPNERLEIMLFINNYEFFHFNLIRRLALFIAAIFFGSMIPTFHYLSILTGSLSITALSSIAAILLIKYGANKAT